MGIEYTARERMLYGESVAWKYISKKEFLIKNNILMPNCLGASHVVYMILVALKAQFVSIHEPLYFYRRMRKGSILDVNGKGSKEEGKMGLKQLSIVIEEFKKRNLYDTYVDDIERAIKYRMSDLLAAQYGRKSLEDFQIQYKNYYEFIDINFPKTKNDKYAIVGGYNLNRILSYLPEIQNPYLRFNFSSIISIMYPVGDNLTYVHSNTYRLKMIEKDVKSLFWSILKEEKPGYLFIDFIEERFDIIKIGNGYITKSDAYDGAHFEADAIHIINAESDEYRHLWDEACKNFFIRIQNYIPLKNVYVIENYLSEQYGDIEQKYTFENIIDIKAVNQRLKRMYNFVRKEFEQIKVVEAYKCSLYFTDGEYEYGAIPSHLNEVVNKKIAEKICEEMDKN